MERECPEARELLFVLIRNLRRVGPSPAGYRVKTLGAKLGGLWQINLKIRKRQVRLLYAPYNGNNIVLFRIHRKSSPEEQERAYRLAMDRKRQYEITMKLAQRDDDDGNRSLH